MPDAFDFEKLRELISRSRRLKKEAARINSDALQLDTKIAEELAGLRSQVTEAQLDQLQAEAAEVDLAEDVRGDQPAASDPGSNGTAPHATGKDETRAQKPAD